MDSSQLIAECLFQNGITTKKALLPVLLKYTHTQPCNPGPWSAWSHLQCIKASSSFRLVVWRWCRSLKLSGQLLTRFKNCKTPDRSSTHGTATVFIAYVFLMCVFWWVDTSDEPAPPTVGLKNKCVSVTSVVQTFRPQMESKPSEAWFTDHNDLSHPAAEEQFPPSLLNCLGSSVLSVDLLSVGDVHVGILFWLHVWCQGAYNRFSWIKTSSYGNNPQSQKVNLTTVMSRAGEEVSEFRFWHYHVLIACRELLN